MWLIFIVVLIVIGVLVLALALLSSPKEKAVQTVHTTEKDDLSLQEYHEISTASVGAPVDFAYFQLKGDIRLLDYLNVDKAVKASIEQKIPTINPIPSASMQVLNILNNPNSSVNEFGAIIRTDPVLSGKILQAVNSAYFSPVDRIASVDAAIGMLGVNNVRSMVIQSSIHKTLPTTKSGYDRSMLDALWVHSAAVSTCADYLGRHIFKMHDNDLATIGLLHDIAKYFLPMFERVGEEAEGAVGIVQEEKIYGINHALLGSLIARNWNFTPKVVDGIEFHHHPIFFPLDRIPEWYLKISFIICLSDLLCNILGYTGTAKELLPIRKEYYEMFGLYTDIRQLLTAPLLKELEKTRYAVEFYKGY
jgi:HD-like signal output (HDOD) protein